MSRSLKISDCKAKFLSIAEEVAHSSERVVVTKRGKPLVDVVPHQAKNKERLWHFEGPHQNQR
jgi:prevent-host-death family protein